MTLDIPPSRPAVLDRSTADRLARLLGFRHVTRNLYAWTLRREDMDALLSEISEAHRGLERDLLWGSAGGART